MIRSKSGQRALGLFLVGLSIPMIIWEWHGVLTTGEYHPHAAALFPVGAVGGLGMIIFPVDYDAIRAEYGVDRIQTFRQLPPDWKVLSFVALGAGLMNWYLMAHM